LWSYSSLEDVDACPRRWMLSRARYPDVWNKRGYPQVPHPAALLGDVIHRALEVIVEALNSAGCTATNTGDVVKVLRGLGGLSAVLREAIDRKIEGLVDNPRISDEAREGVRQSLINQVGVASNRVQLFLSRGTLPAWAADVNTEVEENQGEGRGGGGPRRRSPVGVGAHPEVDVAADELRLWGRIDLVTVDKSGVTLTDYKSGQENPAHDDQVRLYALLWELDTETNPKHTAATELVVSYPTRNRVVPALDTPALRGLEAAIRVRIEQADEQTAENPPLAKPGPETCQFCQVRQLCTEYWREVVPDPAAVAPKEWFDLEGTVLRQNGIKSWVVEAARGGGAEVLVRTQSPSETLPLGRTVRLLGVRRLGDPDEPDKLIATLGSTSEKFVVEQSS
jgi:hypothetical protein